MKERKIGFVKLVHSHLIQNMISSNICEFIQEKNRTNVKNVRNGSHNQVRFPDIAKTVLNFFNFYKQNKQKQFYKTILQSCHPSYVSDYCMLTPSIDHRG